MFLDRVIHFGETLGDQVKGRSATKLKSLIEVPNLVHVKVHVLSFNKILVSSQYRVLTPSYTFLGKLGDKVKARSPKKLKILKEVPKLCQVEVHVFSFSMILLSPP